MEVLIHLDTKHFIPFELWGFNFTKEYKNLKNTIS